jgi:hypothetical protein
MTPSTPRRGLTIRSAAIPEVNGVPLLEPLKLEGEEGLNTLFEYRLVLQSAEGGGGNHLDLNRFIGRELTCCLELEGQGSFVPGVPGGAGANQGAGVREISGLITEARYIGESGRHALVEFTLRPWLHLATLSTDCKVFQDQSPVEIIEAVLGEYRENFPLTNIASACRAKSEVDGIRSRMGFELGIPGAHSDVGGGYKAGTAKPESAEVRHLPSLRGVHDHEGTTTLPGPRAFVYAQGWYTEQDRQPHAGMPHRHVRQVQGDYYKVGLSLMVDMAERHTTTQYPDKLKAEMQATAPEVAQVQQQLRAFAKDNAFVAWKPAQQSWGLAANLGTEQAQAFRRRFLHLSFSEVFAMQPRYLAGTEQLERGHVLG